MAGASGTVDPLGGGPRVHATPRKRRPRLLRERPRGPAALAGLWLENHDRFRLGSRPSYADRTRAHLAPSSRRDSQGSSRGCRWPARGGSRPRHRGHVLEGATPCTRRCRDSLGDRGSRSARRDITGQCRSDRARLARHRRAAGRLLRRADLVGVQSRRRRFRQSGTVLHGNARDRDVHGGAGVRPHPAAAPGHEAARPESPGLQARGRKRKRSPGAASQPERCRASAQRVRPHLRPLSCRCRGWTSRRTAWTSAIFPIARPSARWTSNGRRRSSSRSISRTTAPTA